MKLTELTTNEYAFHNEKLADANKLADSIRDNNLEQIRLSLINEANQLILIFASILRKLEV